MYADFFGLERDPFSIAPDPRYLFMSERHRDALAHLLYGLGGGGGFVLLTGEIGTGKTTLTRLFLEQVPPSCKVAYIFNPKLTVPELLQTICEEFGIEVAPGRDATTKDRIDALNAFLLQAHAEGSNCVLVIDEAQNLSADVLEQLRLLTNLETAERKLLQIVLVGQPELRDMLATPGLEQLAQRVIARYHLGRLTVPETAQYVQHRMEVAGLKRALPFDAGAVRRVHQHARGVPRRINLLCDRALLGAFAHSRERVDAAIVDRAAVEVFGTPRRERMPMTVAAAIGALGLVAAAGLYAAVVHLRAAREPVVAGGAVAGAPVANVALRTAPAASTGSAASTRSTPSPASTPQLSATPGWPPQLLPSMDDAWRELAREWQADAGAAASPCAALAAADLQCFQRPMTLPQLQALDRPGIVTLDPAAREKGGAGQAVLVGVTPSAVLLKVAGTTHAVPLAGFAARWHGDFATLWRSPAGYARRTPAATDVWVAQRLAQARPEAGQPGPDAPLRVRLRAFQLAHGLPGDGQPGPLTYMQLNRATGIAEPALRTQP